MGLLTILVSVLLGSGDNSHLPLSLGFDEVMCLLWLTKCEWSNCDSCLLSILKNQGLVLRDLLAILLTHGWQNQDF